MIGPIQKGHINNNVVRVNRVNEMKSEYESIKNTICK